MMLCGHWGRGISPLCSVCFASSCLLQRTTNYTLPFIFVPHCCLDSMTVPTHLIYGCFILLWESEGMLVVVWMTLNGWRWRNLENMHGMFMDSQEIHQALPNLLINAAPDPFCNEIPVAGQTQFFPCLEELCLFLVLAEGERPTSVCIVLLNAKTLRKHCSSSVLRPISWNSTQNKELSSAQSSLCAILPSPLADSLLPCDNFRDGSSSDWMALSHSHDWLHCQHTANLCCQGNFFLHLIFCTDTYCMSLCYQRTTITTLSGNT